MIPMKKRGRAFALAGLMTLVTAGGAAAQPMAEPESAADLALALRRLGPTQRVLMIGAHPDDENTAVLAELALGSGADVAYLSLTRGEGGQNLIGPELQEGLGLIRSEELLSARRLDGAQQFFTRAYDYGFSKSADEAFLQWPRDSLLADVVAVVRRFRPDVVIAVFSGTPRDGHGQHQASGIMARDAFTAAADPARFPGQIAQGLAPHRTRYLMQALWRGSEEGAIELRTGDYDPVLGRSHYQLAMASRSRHRSQDMGQAQPPGPQSAALLPVAGDPPADARSPFAGLDTTLAQRAADGPARTALMSYDSAVARAKDVFNPLRAGDLVAPLARAIAALDRAAGAMEDEDLRFHIVAERAQAARALQLAAGVTLEAVANRQRVVPGGTFELVVRLWNGGSTPIEVSALAPRLPDGWTARATGTRTGAAFALQPGELVERTFDIAVAADADPTEPYFLQAPRDGAMYAWPDDAAVRGLPFEAPPILAGATLRIADAVLELDEAAAFVEVDKSFGELRLPVFVVPAVAVDVAPRVAVIPLGATADDDGTSREIVVTLTTAEAVAGSLSLEMPSGWRAEPAAADVAFEAAGERRSVTFRVAPPPNPGPGEVHITARFAAADGRSYDEGYEVIAYPHTRPRTLYAPAVTRIALFPVTLAEGLRIGYIEGAGDDGALALRQMGAAVEAVDAQMLARGDLSQFDVLVAGIRAYEVRPDLIENNARVLEWVRGGGTFVVNYNKYELVEGDFTPFPMTMARPHGRVTDEGADVTLLRPEHPLLAWPNDIGPQDFDGWVQERGLYFAETWDDRYTPVLAMHDPGEDPLQGSLLSARVGDGYWIYTGLALFRQWPEAVPGAFRLLANMVSIGRAPQ